MKLIKTLPILFSFALIFSVNRACADEIKPTEISIEKTFSVLDVHLQAIQDKDADTVFGYASQAAKEKYRTPRAYLRMIRHSYKPLYDHKSYSLRGQWYSKGMHIHKVEFVLYDGSVHTALIRFRQHDDMHWSMVDILILNQEATPI